MKIQQMAFMILAVFFFFILVGLFFLSLQFRDMKNIFNELQKEQAISSLQTISNMQELNYKTNEPFTLDEDKLTAMKNIESYENFWPVSSIKVYKISANDKLINCPAFDCNYYEVYNDGQKRVRDYSTFVSICKRVREFEYVYDKCEVGKLVVGVKLNG
ncbi:MAG: hypothetical protein Q8N88_00485 [Nanoarchaeota archaeon]|nr:hypothetical protein [Nanoarchaeota archaeon]